MLDRVQIRAWQRSGGGSFSATNQIGPEGTTAKKIGKVDGFIIEISESCEVSRQTQAGAEARYASITADIFPGPSASG